MFRIPGVENESWKYKGDLPLSMLKQGEFISEICRKIDFECLFIIQIRVHNWWKYFPCVRRWLFITQNLSERELSMTFVCCPDLWTVNSNSKALSRLSCYCIVDSQQSFKRIISLLSRIDIIVATNIHTQKFPEVRLRRQWQFFCSIHVTLRQLVQQTAFVISHFRVVFCLCFKTSPARAQLFESRLTLIQD